MNRNIREEKILEVNSEAEESTGKSHSESKKGMNNPKMPEDLDDGDGITNKSVKFGRDLVMIPSDFGGRDTFDARDRLRGKTKADLTQTEGEIFPFKKLDRKKRNMLKKARQPSWLQTCCFCCFKNSNIVQKRKLNFRRRKVVTVIDMLENLFVQYDEKLVNLLWRKEVFMPLETKKIRDDLTYFMPQIV